MDRANLFTAVWNIKVIPHEKGLMFEGKPQTLTEGCWTSSPGKGGPVMIYVQMLVCFLSLTLLNYAADLKSQVWLFRSTLDQLKNARTFRQIRVINHQEWSSILFIQKVETLVKKCDITRQRHDEQSNMDVKWNTFLMLILHHLSSSRTWLTSKADLGTETPKTRALHAFSSFLKHIYIYIV